MYNNYYYAYSLFMLFVLGLDWYYLIGLVIYGYYIFYGGVIIWGIGVVGYLYVLCVLLVPLYIYLFKYYLF